MSILAVILNFSATIGKVKQGSFSVLELVVIVGGGGGGGLTRTRNGTRNHILMALERIRKELRSRTHKNP